MELHNSSKHSTQVVNVIYLRCLTAEPAHSGCAGNCRAKCVGYLSLLTQRDAVEEWKSQRAPRDGFCEIEIAYVGPTRGAPCRLQVNRCEVAARGDALPKKCSLDPLAVGA